MATPNRQAPVAIELQAFLANTRRQEVPDAGAAASHKGDEYTGWVLHDEWDTAKRHFLV